MVTTSFAQSSFGVREGIGTVSSISFSFAQSSFGVRVGVSVSNIYDPQHDFDYGYRLGYYASAVYQYQQRNMFVETALTYITKGAYDKISISETSYTFKCGQNLGYLQIPIKVGYVLSLEDVFFKPYLGLSYSYGIHGKCIVNLAGVKYESPSFGKDGLYKHSDFGGNVGFGVYWEDYSFHFGYEHSFLNIYNEPDYETRNGSFVIGIGYNF